MTETRHVRIGQDREARSHGLTRAVQT